MVAFVDAHRGAYGVEPISAVLPIAPSVYYEHKARARNPERLPLRARRNLSLAEHIGRVWREHRSTSSPQEQLGCARCQGRGKPRVTRSGGRGAAADSRCGASGWPARCGAGHSGGPPYPLGQSCIDVRSPAKRELSDRSNVNTLIGATEHRGSESNRNRS
jgi:hypothetical protein